MKRSILLLAVICLICSCPAAALAQIYEGDGFATPEEAVLAYLEGTQKIFEAKAAGWVQTNSAA